MQHGSKNGEEMLVYPELHMMSAVGIQHGEENSVLEHCITSLRTAISKISIMGKGTNTY